MFIMHNNALVLCFIIGDSHHILAMSLNKITDWIKNVITYNAHSLCFILIYNTQWWYVMPRIRIKKKV